MVANTFCSGSTFESRLRAYSAMSLAFAAAGIPRAAHAATIAMNAGISTSPSTPSIFFDLATLSYGTTAHNGWFELSTDAHGLVTKDRLVAGSNQLSFAVSEFAVSAFSSQPAAARLSRGALVGPNLTFARTFSTLGSNVGAPFGFWNGNAAPADLGLSILTGGGRFYGWADISVNPMDYTITLNSFGRSDTPGEVVPAGQVTNTPPGVPEPASIVLLCLGAAGIEAYRRKNKLD
jgi:hypothetical protein